MNKSQTLVVLILMAALVAFAIFGKRPEQFATKIPENAPAAIQQTTARFTKDANGIITDHQANLQWYDGKTAHDGKVNTWYRADAKARTLTVDGGGWTLATRNQLKGLHGEGWKSGLFYSEGSWSSELGPPQDQAYEGDRSTAWMIVICNNKEVGERWEYRSKGFINDTTLLAVRSCK